jgi:hypothetical protein
MEGRELPCIEESKEKVHDWNYESSWMTTAEQFLGVIKYNTICTT